MKLKIHKLTMLAIVAASAVLLGTAANARAADEWFVMGEKSIDAAGTGAEMKTQGGRWDKNVKKVKLSVEGADVTFTKVILFWDNRRDDTLDNLGTVKAGGETTPHDAPGRKTRLTKVEIQYKILGKAKMATVKIWGYD